MKPRCGSGCRRFKSDHLALGRRQPSLAKSEGSPKQPVQVDFGQTVFCDDGSEVDESGNICGSRGRPRCCRRAGCRDAGRKARHRGGSWSTDTPYSGAGSDAGGASFRYAHRFIGASASGQPDPVLGTGSQSILPALGGPSIRPVILDKQSRLAMVTASSNLARWFPQVWDDRDAQN